MNSQNSTRPDESSYNRTSADMDAFDSGVWGIRFEPPTMATAGPAHPPHVTVERIGTLEGILMVARCTACGGRDERLLDFRDLAEMGQDSLHAMMITMDACADAKVAQWAAAHAGCMVVPQQHDTFVEVEGLLQMAYTTAVADVRAGEPLANELLVLMNDGLIFCLPLAELPTADRDDQGSARTKMTHAFHATVRERARRTGTRPLAAVFVGDAWPLPSIGDGLVKRHETGEPGPREVLTAMAATPEAVMLGVAPITRDGGVSGVGPGRVGRLAFDLVKTASPLTDGLFAANCVS